MSWSGQTLYVLEDLFGGGALSLLFTTVFWDILGWLLGGWKGRYGLVRFFHPFPSAFPDSPIFCSSRNGESKEVPKGKGFHSSVYHEVRFGKGPGDEHNNNTVEIPKRLNGFGAFLEKVPKTGKGGVMKFIFHVNVCPLEKFQKNNSRIVVICIQGKVY